MKTALAILGLTISASPLVNEDVLEPSVENEVEHALAVAPSNEVALAEAALQRHDVEKARGYATVVTTLFENSPFAKRAEEILKSNLEEVQ